MNHLLLTSTLSLAKRESSMVRRNHGVRFFVAKDSRTRFAALLTADGDLHISLLDSSIVATTDSFDILTFVRARLIATEGQRLRRIIGPSETTRAFCDELALTKIACCARQLTLFGAVSTDKFDDRFQLITATALDRTTVVNWARAANEELGEDADAFDLSILESGRVKLLKSKSGDSIGSAGQSEAFAMIAVSGFSRRFYRLSQLYVPPEFRRRGVARALLALVDQEHKKLSSARALQINGILFADVQNKKAHALYVGLGYSILGEHCVWQLGSVN